jgi:hypothetical protein
MTFPRAALVTLLTLAMTLTAVAQFKGVPRPPEDEKSRLDAEKKLQESWEAMEKARRARAVEEEAIAYCEVVTDLSERAVARKQAALAVRDMTDVSSWLVVLRLRACEGDEDADVRAAVRAALAAVKPPADPEGLHEIICHYKCGSQVSQVYVLACETLGKQFPTHPLTVPTLRNVLKASKEAVSVEARGVAAATLDSLPAKGTAGERKK